MPLGKMDQIVFTLNIMLVIRKDQISDFARLSVVWNGVLIYSDIESGLLGGDFESVLSILSTVCV